MKSHGIYQPKSLLELEENILTQLKSAAEESRCGYSCPRQFWNHFDSFFGRDTVLITSDKVSDMGDGGNSWDLQGQSAALSVLGHNRMHVYSNLFCLMGLNTRKVWI